jgi:hypothetical protein
MPAPFVIAGWFVERCGQFIPARVGHEQFWPLLHHLNYLRHTRPSDARALFYQLPATPFPGVAHFHSESVRLPKRHIP